MTRRIIVTGGAGFIGSNFVHYWAQQHPKDRIVVVDSLTYAGNLRSIQSLLDKSLVEFLKCDIRDECVVLDIVRSERATHIVHFAAESHVDRSINGPDLFIETNIAGTHNLLKAARKVWLQEKLVQGPVLFHHISTDEVYGSLGPTDLAFHEATPYAPNSPYAASKAASDHLVRAYHHTYGLPSVMTNCSNNYGPYQYPEKLVPLMLINALEGKPLPVYGNGQNIRDWLFVEDHCRAIELVLKGGRSGSCYNIGGNCEIQNIDLVLEICRHIDDAFKRNPELTDRFPKCPAALGTRCAELITYVQDRPGHDLRYAVNSSKISSEFGFLPKSDIKTGLQKTLKWYLENETWWKAIMNGSYRDWIIKQYG